MPVGQTISSGFLVTTTNTGAVVFSTPYPPGSPGALTGTATSAFIPAGTLQPGTTYQGNLFFLRTVNTNGVGFANLGIETLFNLTTTGKTVNSTPPHLAVSGYSSSAGFSLLLTGTASQNYAIQASTNMVNWTNLTVISVPSSSPVVYTDAGAKTLGHRYYRAVSQ